MTVSGSGHDSFGNGCHYCCDHPLTSVPLFVTFHANHLARRKDAAAEANCGGGARGGARGRACNLLPGGPGIMPAGITTGVRGASLEVGAEPAVISAALAKHPRSLARIAPRDYTPLGKSRGGTPEGEPHPPIQGAAPHRKRCGGYGPASSGVPYPFICHREKRSDPETEESKTGLLRCRSQ
jgi:hypothetical protein